MHILCRFWCWRFYRSVFYREVLTFLIWSPPHMMDHDVSLHDLVKLFVAIPTSLRSSKSESWWKSYCRFRIGVSADFWGAEVPDFRPEIPAPPKVPAIVPAQVQYRFLAVFLGSGSSGMEVPALWPEDLSVAATAIFVGGAINTPPLLQPWAAGFLSLSHHCWPWKACPSLNSSRESCISLREKWEET